ncbi:hypothetical protein YC2023_114455 [Brassica napus]
MKTKREKDKEGDDKKVDDKEGGKMLMKTKKKLDLKNLKAKYRYVMLLSLVDMYEDGDNVISIGGRSKGSKVHNPLNQPKRDREA